MTGIKFIVMKAYIKAVFLIGSICGVLLCLGNGAGNKAEYWYGGMAMSYGLWALLLMPMVPNREEK